LVKVTKGIQTKEDPKTTGGATDVSPPPSPSKGEESKYESEIQYDEEYLNEDDSQYDDIMEMEL
jgi:hypothetical protein